jgi:hypothetical protein
MSLADVCSLAPQAYSARDFCQKRKTSVNARCMAELALPCFVNGCFTLCKESVHIARLVGYGNRTFFR